MAKRAYSEIPPFDPMTLRGTNRTNRLVAAGLLW
jgi:hypothetical protein